MSSSRSRLSQLKMQKQNQNNVGMPTQFYVLRLAMALIATQTEGGHAYKYTGCCPPDPVVQEWIPYA